MWVRMCGSGATGVSVETGLRRRFLACGLLGDLGVGQHRVCPVYVDFGDGRLHEYLRCVRMSASAVWLTGSVGNLDSGTLRLS